MHQQSQIGDDGMRDARHALVADHARGGRDLIRRTGVLALATVAALLTLLLPTPAAARPAALGNSALASTGGPGSGSISSVGRRDDRRAHVDSSAAAGTAWSGSVVGSAASGHPAAVAAGSHHAGQAPVAALSTVGRTAAPALTAARTARGCAGLASSSVDSPGSRAPPGV